MALFAMGAPADNVNRLRRRARVGKGFLHHHRDRASTTAVRQNAPPGPTRTGWEYPPVPLTSLEPDASLYRLNLWTAVG